MIQALLIALAFASATLFVAGVALWVRAVIARNPEARLAFEGSRGRSTWLFRVWELMVQIAAREFPDTYFYRLRQRIERDLLRAGAPADSSADRFLAQALLEGAGLAAVLAVVIFAAIGKPMLLLALGVGLLYSLGIRPQMLRSEAAERVGRISRRLPYAIDLAALVLGAGGTPREALEMIAHQENDALAEEFSFALAEIHNGAPQHKALSAMAKRVQLEDLETLVIAINRGEAVGAPMAKALETQAEVFRFRRLQRAERLAVEAPVKMMFPNMLIMLSVLLLVLGPVIVKLVQEGLL